MGDIETDDTAFMRTLGPQVDRLSMGLIKDRMQAVSDEAVAAAVAADERRFEIDGDLSEEQHRYASRFEVAIQDLLRGGLRRLQRVLRRRGRRRALRATAQAS